MLRLFQKLQGGLPCLRGGGREPLQQEAQLADQGIPVIIGSAEEGIALLLQHAEDPVFRRDGDALQERMGVFTGKRNAAVQIQDIIRNGAGRGGNGGLIRQQGRDLILREEALIEDRITDQHIRVGGQHPQAEGGLQAEGKAVRKPERGSVIPQIPQESGEEGRKGGILLRKAPGDPLQLLQQHGTVPLRQEADRIGEGIRFLVKPGLREGRNQGGVGRGHPGGEQVPAGNDQREGLAVRLRREGNQERRTGESPEVKD